jgi:hypothetical protein
MKAIIEGELHISYNVLQVLTEARELVTGVRKDGPRPKMEGDRTPAVYEVEASKLEGLARLVEAKAVKELMTDAESTMSLEIVDREMEPEVAEGSVLLSIGSNVSIEVDVETLVRALSPFRKPVR